MPKRRKFVIGLGALATGTSAAVGSGAFETAAADRTVNVDVASDSSGFVEITGQNERYASGTGDGQLELNFNGDALDGGSIIGPVDDKGLNPNTEYTFSEVFRVANIGGTGDMRVVIEANGFNLENLEITAAGTQGNVSEGTSLKVEDYSNVDNLPKLFQPGSVNVDMTIETKNDSTMGNVGGTLTIHAATGGNRSELSDVL
jgi:hypothetical protein